MMFYPCHTGLAIDIGVWLFMQLFDIDIITLCVCVCFYSSERRLWTVLLFVMTSVLFSARTIVPLVAVNLSKEFGWDKTDTVSSNFVCD